MQSSSPVPVMVAAPGPGRTVDLRETARSRGQHLVALTQGTLGRGAVSGTAPAPAGPSRRAASLSLCQQGLQVKTALWGP